MASAFLELGIKVADLLQKHGTDQDRGLDASLLVPEETDISLPERCRRVNEWCRQLGKDNVLLISIHCNAAGRGDRWLTARGCCAYTTREGTQA